MPLYPTRNSNAAFSPRVRWKREMETPGHRHISLIQFQSHIGDT